MARARKTPKPKPVTYERVDRQADSKGVYKVLDKCLKQYRSELRDEDCRIAVAWRYGLKKNKDGQLVLGKCKKASDLDKQFSQFDFVVILNHEAWTSMLDDEQKEALMHHELMHIGISEDQNGNTKKDSRNRTMFRVRKHDIEEFADIVAQHGCYKADLEQFVIAALNSKVPLQPPLPGMDAEAPATIPMPSAANETKEPKEGKPARGRKAAEAGA